MHPKLFHPLISAWLQIPQFHSKLKKFWASLHNKQNLQLLVEILVRGYNKSTLMSSIIIEDKLHSAVLFTDGQAEEVNALSDSWLEEADERLLIHVGGAVDGK